MRKVQRRRLEGLSWVGAVKLGFAALMLFAFALPAPAAPWIQVKILNVECTCRTLRV